MLIKKYYTWGELENKLMIQFTKKNNRSKLIKRNIEPFYVYEVIKEGRAQIGLNILSNKEKEKSEFIQLCEKFACREVLFPKEETAEMILKFLLEKDRTIYPNSWICLALPEQKHEDTIGTYLSLFRDYGLLPKKKEKIPRMQINIETGEIFSKTLDPNKYDYYKVSTRFDVREHINKEKYYEMKQYERIKVSEYILEFVNEQMNKKEISKLKVKAYEVARVEVFKEYGAYPMRAFTKSLTKEAFKVFSEYFGIKKKTEELWSELESSFDCGLTEHERKFLALQRTLPNSISVVGRDPMARDHDKEVIITVKEETRKEQLKYYKNELKYFQQLQERHDYHKIDEVIQQLKKNILILINIPVEEKVVEVEQLFAKNELDVIEVLKFNNDSYSSALDVYNSIF
ncbi:hypothetical protein ACIQWQ_07865 [Peribacillus frigoritolerans]